MDWMPAWRLDTAGYPPIEVSYGRDTSRSEYSAALSILSLYPYQPYLSYRIGIYPICRIRYTARAEYPMARIQAGRLDSQYRPSNHFLNPHPRERYKTVW